MAENKYIEVGGRLHSIATGNVLAGANEVFDDDKGKKQSDINTETDTALEDRYTKDQTYSKSELNNMITTPNQEYVSVTATAQTTAVTDVLPATGEADTVYRVGNWDGSQFDASVYSEYAWNGSQYVHLCTKTQIGEVFDISAYHATGGTLATYADLSAALDSNNGGGVPQSLQKGGMSVKYVQSSDNKYVQCTLKSQNWSTNIIDWIILSDSTYYNVKDYIHLWLDNKSRIIFGVKRNGDVCFGYGVPAQIVNYINSKLSELHVEEISDFIGSLIESDKTLQELLGEKVDKIEGKGLIKTAVSEYFDSIPSNEFMSLELDEANRVLSGRKSDGTKFENMPMETPSAIFKSFADMENRFNIILDSKNHIISFRDKKGVLHENAGVKTPLVSADELYVSDRNIVEYLNDVIVLVNSFRNNFEIDNKLRMFDSMICIGDSVTDGHIFWRRKGNVVSRKYSYPSQLNKMFPEMSITNAGFAGITIDGWNKNKFSNYDFKDYNVVIIELGYNSGTKPISDTFDTDVAPYGDDYMSYADTGMGNYCQLIKKIQNANPYIFVILVCSRAQSDSKKQGIFRVAQEFDLPLIDLSDTTLYPINFEDGNMPFDNTPAVHASPWGYLLKASYIRRGIGKAIDEYYERAVTYVFGQNDWIWKITCEMSDSTKGIVNTPYVEVIACYTGIISCEINEGETFEGWYYNNNGTEVLLSSEKTFTFDPYSYQELFRYQTPRAITVIAKVS